MPRNGSGTYTLPQPPFVPQTTISSSAVNSDFSDIASAITASIAANGETEITGQLKFPSGSAAQPSHSFASDLTTGMYFAAASKIGFSIGGTATLIIDRTKVGSGQNGGILQYGTGAILMPVGTVIDFAGSTIPTGWGWLNGQSVLRSGYPELFTVMGTAFGSGDGSTTFNLPDIRGRVTAGKDNMGGSSPTSRLTSTTMTPDAITLGATGGAQTFTLAQGNIPSYSLTSFSLSVGTTISNGTQIYRNPSNISVQSGSGVNNVAASGSTETLSLASGTVSGSISSGGSGNAFNKIQPTIIMNKIIFLGRA